MATIVARGPRGRDSVEGVLGAAILVKDVPVIVILWIWA